MSNVTTGDLARIVTGHPADPDMHKIVAVGERATGTLDISDYEVFELNPSVLHWHVTGRQPMVWFQRPITNAIVWTKPDANGIHHNVVGDRYLRKITGPDVLDGTEEDVFSTAPISSEERVRVKESVK